MKHSDETENTGLPVAPVQRWLVPFVRFMHIEAASGIVLLLCTVIALALANSPWAYEFKSLWKLPVSFTFGGFTLVGDLGHLIVNDALMTIFFFVVGLEVKREIVAGELRDPRKALLPVFGALGGVLFPAGIYLAMQWGEVGQRGWAIPMATDIAFVVGFIALFGKKVPFGLKIFLLTLAIVDDIVAVLVIALVFTSSMSWSWLTVAAIGFAICYFFNRIGVRAVGIYLVVGSVIWLAFLKAGIHPTVAGVMLGLLTPASAWIGQTTLFEYLGAKFEALRNHKNGASEPLPVDLEKLQIVARESLSPLHRLEHGLHPWVAFLIMPVFALANAGVPLTPSAISDPVAMAVACGLMIGKPVGIFLLCFIAVKIGVTRLPQGVNWLMMLGGAALAGIGFTMALFINGLAFPVAEFPLQETAGKIGTLTGSLISAILGSIILIFALRKVQPAH